MSILYIGDTHGFVENFSLIERRAKLAGASAIVQLGDFGIFWPGCQKRMVQYFEKRLCQDNLTIPWFFCDGNHDEHDVLDQLWEEAGKPEIVEVAPNCFHARRGTIIEIDGIKHIFCGGARSTDRGPGYREFFKQGRRLKRIWWPQEAPSNDDLNHFYKNIQNHAPDVVISHDSPVCIDIYRDGRKNDPTARGFQRIFELCDVKPKRWFFGHHHIHRTWTIEGTDFYCGGKHGDGWIWDPNLGVIDASVIDRKEYAQELLTVDDDSKE